MRWLIVALLLLAGCTQSGGSLLPEAEAARAATHAAMGPEGTLSDMAGTVGIDVDMGGDALHMTMEFGAAFHEGDAFSIDMQTAATGHDEEFDVAVQLLCTPEEVVMVMAQTERVAADNPRGTCLPESTNIFALLQTFDGLSEDMAFDDLGLGWEEAFAYTDAFEEGGAIIAITDVERNMNGILMEIDGRTTIRNGFIDEEAIDMVGDLNQGGFQAHMAVAMDFAYTYGPRDAAPAL